jgi:hypothetical protein
MRARVVRSAALRAGRRCTSHHAALGVDRGAAPAAIKAAYLDGVWRTHPDRTGGDASAFRRIQEAFDALQQQSGGGAGSAARATEWHDAPTSASHPPSASEAWRAWAAMEAGALSSAAAERLLELTVTAAGAQGLRDAQALLLACHERRLFPHADAETAAYNTLLWHCGQGFTEATVDDVMDATLNILKAMDSFGLQPDLELLETQIFTFHGAG